MLQEKDIHKCEIKHVLALLASKLALLRRKIYPVVFLPEWIIPKMFLI